MEIKNVEHYIGVNGRLPKLDVLGNERRPSHQIMIIAEGVTVAIPPVTAVEDVKDRIDAIKAALPKAKKDAK